MPAQSQFRDEVGRRLGAHHARWVAVRVTPDRAEVVTEGIEPEADVAIGSVSKPLTGQLYVDGVARGEITPDTRLAEVLPLAGSAAGGVTLDLARQTGVAIVAATTRSVDPAGFDLVKPSS